MQSYLTCTASQPGRAYLCLSSVLQTQLGMAAWPKSGCHFGPSPSTRPCVWSFFCRPSLESGEFFWLLLLLLLSLFLLLLRCLILSIANPARQAGSSSDVVVDFVLLLLLLMSLFLFLLLRCLILRIAYPAWHGRLAQVRLSFWS